MIIRSTPRDASPSKAASDGICGWIPVAGRPDGLSGQVEEAQQFGLTSTIHPATGPGKQADP